MNMGRIPTLEGDFRILLVDDDNWVRPEFLAEIFKDTLQANTVECFVASTIDDGFDLFCSLEAERPIDLLIVDLSLPESLKERASEKRIAKAECEFGRADYVDKMGGLKLVGLILDHLRQKSGDPSMMINFPTAYLSGWDFKAQHRELIKLYHRSLSFDWIYKPIVSESLIARCTDLIRAYDLCFKRRESA